MRKKSIGGGTRREGDGKNIESLASSSPWFQVSSFKYKMLELYGVIMSWFYTEVREGLDFGVVGKKQMEK